MWSPNGGEDGLPDTHTPGWIWLWSPNGEYDSFSNHCKERTIGSHCLLPLVGLGQPSGRSQAVGTDQAEGVRDDAGWRRRAQGSRDGARRRWSLLVPMCSQGRGSIRAASGTTLGPPGTRNLKENRRFYGFTDFRGKPGRRGRGRHASANQVTAGLGRRVAVAHTCPWALARRQI